MMRMATHTAPHRCVQANGNVHRPTAMCMGFSHLIMGQSHAALLFILLPYLYVYIDA
jgi:hypothetical protein